MLPNSAGVATLLPTSILERCEPVPFKQTADDQGLLLNLTTGDFFDIAGVGIAFWHAVDGSRSLAEIAGQLALQYDVESKECLADLLPFAQELLGHGLVRLVVPA